jgi:hypothetical protein
MKKYLNYQRWLFGFGGANGISSRIEFCGKCIPGWKIFMKNMVTNILGKCGLGIHGLIIVAATIKCLTSIDYGSVLCGSVSIFVLEKRKYDKT